MTLTGDSPMRWKLTVGLTLVALLMILSLTLAAPRSSSRAGLTADWPGWRGASRDGKSPDRGLLRQWPEGGPKRLWQVSGIGKGFGSVSVVGGMIYTTGERDGQFWVFAFDEQGRPRWREAVDKVGAHSYEGSRSTPTIDQGRAYVLSGNGLVACLDARTGRKQWSRSARQDFGGAPGGWGYAESVLILGNLAVFKPGGENFMVALDKTNGQTVWKSHGFEAGPEYSSCLAFTQQGKTMIVTGSNRGLVCVDAKDGRVHWSDEFSADNTANCPTPAYADGHVFWANGYGQGGVCMKVSVAGDRATATRAWTTRDMVCHHGGYVIHEGKIYGNHNNAWSCLDLKTGAEEWSARGVGKGSLCFADGMLYLFGEREGRVGLAPCSPAGLELAGEFQVAGEGPSWAHPVVIGGRLYLRYDDNLYCHDVRGTN